MKMISSCVQSYLVEIIFVVIELAIINTVLDNTRK